MKSYSLVFLFITFISTTAYMQDQPRCVKSLNNKIKSIEKKLVKLEGMASEAGSNQFQIAYNGAERDVRSIRKFQAKSCNAELEDYDFTAINQVIDNLEDRFNIITKNLESNQSEGDQLEEWERKLTSFVNYVVRFPRGYFIDGSMDNYTVKSTKAILGKANAGERNFQDIKRQYDEAAEYISSPDFKEAFFQAVDYEYENRQNENNVNNLSVYCDNFDFLAQHVFPEQKPVAEMRDYADKLLAGIKTKQSEKLANVAVNNFHKQHVNKIFFTSNARLNPENASAADFKTDFKAGENIMAVAYLDDNYENIYGEQNEPKFQLDGTTTLYSVNIPEFSGQDWKKPYVTFFLTVDSKAYQSTPGDNPGIVRSIEYLTNLTPRSHQIKVKLGSYLGRPKNRSEDFAVTGTLTFDAADQAEMQSMQKNLVAIRDKDLQSVALPKAGMKNQGYEANLVKVFNSIGWSETFVKAIIGSSDFGYQKDYKGEVVGRILQVYMVSKTAEGGCKYQDFTVIQEKVGDNQWAKNFKRLSTGGFHDISCSNL